MTALNIFALVMSTIAISLSTYSLWKARRIMRDFQHRTEVVRSLLNDPKQ